MTTQPKQYKLLKDLPFAKAGIILKKSEDRNWADNIWNYTEENSAFLNAYENDSDWFELVVEKPKSVMKFDNGAVVEALEYEQSYFCIYMNNNGAIIENFIWTDDHHNHNNLFSHNVFLTKKEAQKALLQQQTYNRLYKKIRQIDEENGFVCDWSNNNEYKYSCFWDYSEEKLKNYDSKTLRNQGTTYMSEQAAEYLCSDAVSEADQKLFCGIMD